MPRFPRFIVLALLANTALVSMDALRAQAIPRRADASGSWQGTMSHQTDGYTPVWQAVLTIHQAGERVTGTTRLQFDDRFAVFDWSGTLRRNILVVTESGIREQSRHPAQWCMNRRMELTLVSSDRLEGTWSSPSPGCSTGRIVLNRSRPALVVFVGGANDASSRFVADLQRDWMPPPGADVAKRYFSWRDEGGIRAEIDRFTAAHPDGKVVLVGHSWGGHTALKAVQYLSPGRRVDLLVTLDPVPHGSAGDPSGRERRRPAGPRPGQVAPTKPQNVVTWLNVWPGHRAPREACGDMVASLGENWAPWGDIPGLQRLHSGRNHCDASGMFYDSVVQRELQEVLGGSRQPVSTGAAPPIDQRKYVLDAQ